MKRVRSYTNFSSGLGILKKQVVKLAPLCGAKTTLLVFFRTPKPRLKLAYMKIFWIFILNFFIFELANALVKEDLYSANIKVLSKEISVEQRKNITEQAFSEILQKITGKPKTLTIQNVDQYLSQYAYSNIDNQTILKIFITTR